MFHRTLIFAENIALHHVYRFYILSAKMLAWNSAAWQRLNKSWCNDRRISNAILQFAQYLICRNSYNPSVANILLTEIIGPQSGRRVGGLRAGKMLRCTVTSEGLRSPNYDIVKIRWQKPKWDAKRDECSFHPLALVE